ncbi:MULTISPECIES: hypothetical protein [Halomonadaceae]|uniref:Uncharacterized protein n=1 Tax=Vreelandella titanicae TaxID=664683 RepID=A0AAP9T170_9GAMM|nr:MULTISPECIES: hypothetical protein [Halomonas]QKS24186.1 hypothetical protein FX987_01960 [Halomonas titanicae]SDI30248.1 hypothetical protein SAMN04487867_104180 [Halomonas titanicae]
MPSIGGRYEIRDGKRVLTHETKPAPVKTAKAPDSKPASVKADAVAPKPTKAVAKKEVTGDE